jgi:hypothetical protein
MPAEGLGLLVVPTQQALAPDDLRPGVGFRVMAKTERE